MILDIFAGFIIICILAIFAFAESLAISAWFIFVPLFVIWFIWLYKREQRRQRNITPEEKIRSDRDLAGLRASNEMFKRAKARNKALYRR